MPNRPDSRPREVSVDDHLWDRVNRRARAFRSAPDRDKTCVTDGEVNRVVVASLHCFLRASAHEVRECMFRAEHAAWRSQLPGPITHAEFNGERRAGDKQGDQKWNPPNN